MAGTKELKERLSAIGVTEAILDDIVTWKELKERLNAVGATEAILNEFVTWLIANEAFQLAARLVMEWDKEEVNFCMLCEYNKNDDGCLQIICPHQIER